jgi:hypothetical protein
MGSQGASGATGAQGYQGAIAGVKQKYYNQSMALGIGTHDVSYTGIGFMPGSLSVSYSYTSGNYRHQGNGYAGQDLDASGIYNYIVTNGTYLTTYTSSVSYNFIRCIVQPSLTIYAEVISYNADGFTLRWTFSGSGSTTGTLTFIVLAFQ